MSLTRLSLDGNNLIIPAQGESGQWHPGWGLEIVNFYLQCNFSENLPFCIGADPWEPAGNSLKTGAAGLRQSLSRGSLSDRKRRQAGWRRGWVGRMKGWVGRMSGWEGWASGSWVRINWTRRGSRRRGASFPASRIWRWFMYGVNSPWPGIY